jgi:hypothetical protein
MFGDRGDARFVVFIHEHVFQSIVGTANLLSPPFFYNQTNTLGYSEAFLLDQIIYAPSRLFGADPFLATSLVPMILSIISFVSLYLILRRLGVSPLVGSTSAVLFTFANNLFLKSIHMQHFAAYYFPVVALCFMTSILDLHDSPRWAYLIGALGAFLFGMTFSTGFYMAWFFTFDLIIFTPIIAYLSWPTARLWWFQNSGYVIRLGLVAASSFLVGLIPFAFIYGPAMIAEGRRDFLEYLAFAPEPADIINAGMLNIVWGPLIRFFGLLTDERLNLTESAVAITPTVQVFALISAALAMNRNFWPHNDRGVMLRALVLASAAVPFIVFLFVIKIGSFSLFRFLYAVLPGAGVIRAGYRGMVVANLFAVVAISLTLEHLLSIIREQRGWHRIPTTAMVGVALGICLAEQLNLYIPTVLRRTSEYSHFVHVGNAPRDCQSFYVAYEPEYLPYEIQVDAMLVALEQKLPTINGYSGNWPPGWNFYQTADPSYEVSLLNWAAQKGVTVGVCRLDVIRGVWSLETTARN